MGSTYSHPPLASNLYWFTASTYTYGVGASGQTVRQSGLWRAVKYEEVDLKVIMPSVTRH